MREVQFDYTDDNGREGLLIYSVPDDTAISEDDAEADALFKIGQQATADSSRLPRMTASVRDHFNNDERIELLEMLFDISYADGEQSPREVEIAEQAGAAIGLQPRDIARARLKIAERQQMLKAGAKLSADY